MIAMHQRIRLPYEISAALLQKVQGLYNTRSERSSKGRQGKNKGFEGLPA